MHQFSVYTGLAASAASDFAISGTLCCVFSHMAHEVETCVWTTFLCLASPLTYEVVCRAYPLLNKLRLFAIQAGVLPRYCALSNILHLSIDSSSYSAVALTSLITVCTFCVWLTSTYA